MRKPIPELSRRIAWGLLVGLLPNVVVSGCFALFAIRSQNIEDISRTRLQLQVAASGALLEKAANFLVDYRAYINGAPNQKSALQKTLRTDADAFERVYWSQWVPISTPETQPALAVLNRRIEVIGSGGEPSNDAIANVREVTKRFEEAADAISRSYGH